MPIKYTSLQVPTIETPFGEFQLACPPSTDEQLGRFRTYRAANYPRLSRSDWREVDYAKLYPTKTWNQSRFGSCAGHAGAKGLEYHRIINGRPHVDLSPTFPYAQVNGGRDRGSAMSDIMQTLMEDGTCERRLCDYDRIYKSQLSREAYDNAQLHKLAEAVYVRGFDEFVSGLILFGPVALGIMVGQNFARLDRDGVAPLPNVIAGGHALCGVAVKQIRGEWMIKVQNSWSEDFGFDGGYCYLSERHFRNMADGFLLVYSDATDKRDDGDEPPIAKLTNPLHPPVTVTVDTTPPVVEPTTKIEPEIKVATKPPVEPTTKIEPEIKVATKPPVEPTVTPDEATPSAVAESVPEVKSETPQPASPETPIVDGPVVPSLQDMLAQQKKADKKK